MTNGLVPSPHSNGSSSPSQGQRAPCIRPIALGKRTPALIFRRRGKASRQKRYIIYEALWNCQSRGSAARRGGAGKSRAGGTAAHHQPAGHPVTSPRRDATQPSLEVMAFTHGAEGKGTAKRPRGHSKDFPRQGQRQAFLAPSEGRKTCGSPGRSG